MAAPDNVVQLEEKFASFSEHWTPKIVGQINDMQLKVVKVQGEFVRHSHHDTDEFFLVRAGRLTIRLRGRDDAVVGPDEFFVVPRGVEHCPAAEDECELLLLEPVGLINTGDGSTVELSAAADVWI